MKSLHVVLEKTQTFEIPDLSEPVEWHIHYVDDKRFIPKRSAQKIVNDYAVTQLPFLLLVDDTLPEDQQEYAAVYSEEGPITLDRINAKL